MDWSTTTEKTEDDCWEWTAYIGTHGYGVVYEEGSAFLAHRFSYEHHVKPIEDGMQINHHCNNRKCVNPEHLYEGTQTENMQDREEAGNNFQTQKTHCPQGHPYNEENTYLYTGRGNQERQCKACHRKSNREYARRYRAKQKANNNRSNI